MSEPLSAIGANYETASMLDEYLLFHYGKDEEILPDDRAWPDGMREALGFPVRTVSHFGPGEVERGLDLGCAVGRSTWEMARLCESVIGIDFSHSFIRAAQQMHEGQPIRYRRLEEGHRFSDLVAHAPDGLLASRISFKQGDAMELPEDLGAFHRVHAANLLCRLGDPVRLIERLPDLVLRGGELVLATPCTWLAAYTPPERWPRPDTLSWLNDLLERDFVMVRCAEEPFLIRETARKFQWTLSMVTVWQRR